MSLSCTGFSTKMRAQEKCLYIDCFGSGPKYHECYSAIKNNTFESVIMRWMKLEPIIQSEVSQKEKQQYSILTHIYGI